MNNIILKTKDGYKKESGYFMNNESEKNKKNILDSSIVLAEIQDNTSESSDTPFIIEESENTKKQMIDKKVNGDGPVKKKSFFKRIIKCIFIIIILAVIVIGIDTGQAILLNNDPIIGWKTNCGSKAGIIIETYHCGNKKHPKLRLSTCSFENVCGYVKEYIPEEEIKSLIQTNLDKILEENASSSSTYDYINNSYYDNIVGLGTQVVPILIEMYENGELSEDGIDAIVAKFLVIDITKCDYQKKYNIRDTGPRNFFQYWKVYNCELNPEPPDANLSISFKDNTITNKGATLILENSSHREYLYETVSIETEKDGSWSELPTVTGLSVQNLHYSSILLGNDKQEASINWVDDYGELKPGKYRLVDIILRRIDSVDEEALMFYIYAEFTID